MTPEPADEPAAHTELKPIAVTTPVAGAEPTGRVPAAAVVVPRGLLYLFMIVAALALASCFVLWQKLSTIQENLARQSQDSGASAIEARALARQAQEISRETAARQAIAETKLSEVALQRSQIEELMQSLSRSRDENMLVDIESALRLAQQQAQTTGSVEPLLSALRIADQRLERAGQPRLSRVRAAVTRDLDRLKSVATTDVPGMLARLDELARLVDDLPAANAVPAVAPASASRKASAPTTPAQWWERLAVDVRDEARGLVRVSRIDQPEAVLLAPDQLFFLRENLKLRLLNARLSLLSRQTDSARADVTAATLALRKYFDPASRKTQLVSAQLQQVQTQLQIVALPRIDESLAVLATAAAGR
ncbi:MAG: uroporphyrinogen-III C-methyltransferase [Ramlibacter sp.]|nr:uroporphyrinogen-III C-methyltransferase [Ramlibacter sp.]